MRSTTLSFGGTGLAITVFAVDPSETERASAEDNVEHMDLPAIRERVGMQLDMIATLSPNDDRWMGVEVTNWLLAMPAPIGRDCEIQ